MGALKADRLVKRMRSADEDKLINEYFANEEEATLSLSDPQLQQLFRLFDRDGNGVIDFTELAYAVNRVESLSQLSEARSVAVQCLLFCEHPDTCKQGLFQRSLDLADFATFLERLCLVMRLPFAALAKQLLEASVMDGPAEGVLPKNSLHPPGEDGKTLEQCKADLLFDLWDGNGDNHISFAELALGIRKFSPPVERLDRTACDAVQAIINFDANSNQLLERNEFLPFLHATADRLHTSFHDLADYLLLLAVLDDDPFDHAAFLHAEPGVTATIADLERQLAAAGEASATCTITAMAAGATMALLPAAMAGAAKRGGLLAADGHA